MEFESFRKYRLKFGQSRKDLKKVIVAIIYFKKWNIAGKGLAQPKNYFPRNGSKQRNRGWGI